MRPPARTSRVLHDTPARRPSTSGAVRDLARLDPRERPRPRRGSVTAGSAATMWQTELEGLAREPLERPAPHRMGAALPPRPAQPGRARRPPRTPPQGGPPVAGP